jgi:hypothetical protein
MKVKSQVNWLKSQLYILSSKYKKVFTTSFTFKVAHMVCRRASLWQQLFALNSDKVESLSVIQVSINPPSTLTIIKGAAW